MMRLQQKCREKATAIPSSSNSSGCLEGAVEPRTKLRGVMFMTGMVNKDNREIGEDQFHDIEGR